MFGCSMKTRREGKRESRQKSRRLCRIQVGDGRAGVYGGGGSTEKHVSQGYVLKKCQRNVPMD